MTEDIGWIPDEEVWIGGGAICEISPTWAAIEFIPWIPALPEQRTGGVKLYSSRNYESSRWK